MRREKSDLTMGYLFLLTLLTLLLRKKLLYEFIHPTPDRCLNWPEKG
jgi:hypothetical protein